MGRKNDLKRVDRAFKATGLPQELRPEFGRYVEQCKRSGAYDLDPDGNCGDEVLRQMAEEFRQGIR